MFHIPSSKDIKRILIISLSNIGDIILTTPVVDTVLKELPHAEVDVMAGPEGEEVFRYYRGLTGLIIYNKHVRIREKLKLYLNLLRRRYELVIDLKNTAFPFLLGAAYFTTPFRSERCILHKKDAHLLRLKRLGIDTSNAEFYIPVTEDDRGYIDEILNSNIVNKAFVVVSPGAKSHVKRWPIKNYAKLCDRIKEECSHEIVFVGTSHDRIVIERIINYMKSRPLNLIEKTNIRQLAYLIKRASLLITNDSAPLHVASAVGKSVVAFFGPTDERKYGPCGRAPSIVLRKNLACSPCEVAQCINKGNKYECLKTISVEEAFKAVRKLLKL